MSRDDDALLRALRVCDWLLQAHEFSREANNQSEPCNKFLKSYVTDMNVLGSISRFVFLWRRSNARGKTFCLFSYVNISLLLLYKTERYSWWYIISAQISLMVIINEQCQISSQKIQTILALPFFRVSEENSFVGLSPNVWIFLEHSWHFCLLLLGVKIRDLVRDTRCVIRELVLAIDILCAKGPLT